MRRLFLLTRNNHGMVDVANGFVVCACSAVAARLYAAEGAGDETAEAWTNPARSTCKIIGEPIATIGEGIVLRDFTDG